MVKQGSWSLSRDRGGRRHHLKDRLVVGVRHVDDLASRSNVSTELRTNHGGGLFPPPARNRVKAAKLRPDPRASTRDMNESDLVFLRLIEGFNRLLCGVEQHFAAFLVEIDLCLRGEPDIALLAGADDEQIAAFFKNGLCFCFGDDVRCSVLLLGQFFLAFGYLSIQPDLNIIIIGFTADGNTAKLTVIDVHSPSPLLTILRL